MSVDATIWAWQRELPATRKLVLLSLADRADEHHRCYPSIARLEKDTGLDRKTIMAAISEMEKDGLLSIKKQQGSVSIYTLVGVHDRHSTSTKNGTSTDFGTSTKNGTQTSTENGTTTSTKNGTQNLPIEPNREPIKETPIVPTAKKERKSSTADAYTQEFDELWKVIPKRTGDSKAEACAQYRSRRKKHAHETIMVGVRAYAAYCAAHVQADPDWNFQKGAANFLGKGEHFLSDWSVDPEKIRRKARKAARQEPEDFFAGAI